MKGLRFSLIVSVLCLYVCVAYAQVSCPAFVRKACNVKYLDSGYVLPVKGIVVAANKSQGGLYLASLGTVIPTLIPNTNTGTCNSVCLTEDGKWILFNQGGPTLIRTDGQFKTKVPVQSYGSEGCCTFWYNAPSGKTEVVYRLSDNKTVRAVEVTLPENGAPTFSNDRVIGQFNSIMEFTMGVAGRHMFARFDDSHYGPKMVTLPANGVATDADFYVPANNDYPSWGCKTTISHDGRLCVYNPGYDQFNCCIADEFYLLRHKSFVILPFQEKTDPAVGWQSVLLKQKAVSINWCPRKYWFLSATDSCKGASAGTSNFWSDFKNWNYTNDTAYIVGDLDCLPYKKGSVDSSAGANMPDSGTIWLVHYPTNTWTMIARLEGGKRLGYPAVWIDKSVHSISPLRDSYMQKQRNLLKDKSMFDIRGRMVPKNQNAHKLPPGIYYLKNPEGVVKRIAVDRF